MFLPTEFDQEKTLALVAAGAALAMILIRKLRLPAAGNPCDPWASEVDLAVRARDAIPLCVDCLYPQEGPLWFCPHCGFSTGDQVTLMPYLQVFAVGEVLRRGWLDRRRKASAGRFFLFSILRANMPFLLPFIGFGWRERPPGNPSVIGVGRR